MTIAMKSMDLEKKGNVSAPRPEVISWPGFYRATDGSVCTQYGGVLISINHIPGSDAVRIETLEQASVSGLYSQTWEEECTTHESMLAVVEKMCNAALSKQRGLA